MNENYKSTLTEAEMDKIEEECEKEYRETLLRLIRNLLEKPTKDESR
jgi:hypothetical protein